MDIPREEGQPCLLAEEQIFLKKIYSNRNVITIQQQKNPCNVYAEKCTYPLLELAPHLNFLNVALKVIFSCPPSCQEGGCILYLCVLTCMNQSQQLHILDT